VAGDYGNIAKVRYVLSRHGVYTVCEGARCPNIFSYWGEGTATFMILGEVCTRECRFCSVRTGNTCGLVDWGEVERLARAVEELGLRYVVVTSVARDGLPDGGASVFCELGYRDV
jgi:lipoic acid synthetase